MSGEQIQTVSEFVNEKMLQLGKDILKGKVQKNPYMRGDKTACTYCPYHNVCDFDTKVPGYRYQMIPEESRDQVLEKMKENDNNQ